MMVASILQRAASESEKKKEIFDGGFTLLLTKAVFEYCLKRKCREKGGLDPTDPIAGLYDEKGSIPSQYGRWET